MSQIAPLTFPELVFLNSYEGNFDSYFNTVYEIFHDHFVHNKPFYNGLRVSAKSYPEVDGIHRTFYHITHEGSDEHNRTPDISRMERIRYPKYMIDSCPHNSLLVWKNTRGRDTRILIFNEENQYLTVLTERPDYYLFWTAYIVDTSHQRRKLIAEYKAFINAETAQ
jgi:hypothetical protein